MKLHHLLCLLLVGLVAGCSSNANISTASCGVGDSVSVQGAQYCVYKASIVEEGFLCPEALSFKHTVGDWVVCAPGATLPDGFDPTDYVDASEPLDSTTADLPSDTTPDRASDTTPDLPDLAPRDQVEPKFDLISCEGGDGCDFAIIVGPNGLGWPHISSGGTLSQAQTLCENSTFLGYSDWRVPTIDELRTLIVGCKGNQPDGTCGVKADCLQMSCWNPQACPACAENDGPDRGCYQPLQVFGSTCGKAYLSSSLIPGTANGVWLVDFSLGQVIAGDTTKVYPARCVRNQQ